jgi:hypothetical protein
VKGQRMLTVPVESYVIVSSGSFYPFHLQGHHLTCFLDCAKTGGVLIPSSCPHNDKNMGLKPVVAQLEADGVINIIKKTYIPKWFRDDYGTVFIFEKLRPLLSSQSCRMLEGQGFTLVFHIHRDQRTKPKKEELTGHIYISAK